MSMIINKSDKSIQSQSHRAPDENWMGDDWVSVPETLEKNVCACAPWCDLVIEGNRLMAVIPLPKPEPKPLPPTENERLTALEQAMLAVMEGGAVHV